MEQNEYVSTERYLNLYVPSNAIPLAVYETDSTTTYGLLNTEFNFAFERPTSLSFFKDALRKKRYNLLKVDTELKGLASRYVTHGVCSILEEENLISTLQS